MSERNIISIELDGKQIEAMHVAFGKPLRDAVPGTLAIMGQPNNMMTAVRFILLTHDEMRAINMICRLIFKSDFFICSKY